MTTWLSPWDYSGLHILFSYSLEINKSVLQIPDLSATFSPNGKVDLSVGFTNLGFFLLPKLIILPHFVSYLTHSGRVFKISLAILVVLRMGTCNLGKHYHKQKSLERVHSIHVSMSSSSIFSLLV